MEMSSKQLDQAALEQWLWDAACKIRGPLDAPKFKDYILPLIFLKRLSDVFDDEVAKLSEEFGDARTAAKLAEQDHKLVRFYIPPASRWKAIQEHSATGLGEFLTDAVRAVARENPALQGVIDVVDFNATAAGQRMLDDGPLAALIQELSRYRLGLRDAEPDILGRAYEYLLRKFAEGQGQSAGEFYTPREVAVLMARILDPQPGMTGYDPCAGSGGLLIKLHLRLRETHGKPRNSHIELPPDVAPLRLHGQEQNPSTFAMARMNSFIHDMDAQIAVGDTMRRPAFKDADGRLTKFDIVTANPMWNQDFEPESTYEHDPFERFTLGIPPGSSADWGWVQHMYASLKPGGRMAVVLDTGSVSRGSGNQGSNRERDIRRKFVEKDLIEAVILLPENLFYNTTSPGIILVINTSKKHPGEVLLVNASKLFSKGRPKNFLADEHITTVHDVFRDWSAREAVSAFVTTSEIASADFNLSPGRWVSTNGAEDVLPLEDALVLLKEAEEERVLADRKLESALASLGLEGWRHD